MELFSAIIGVFTFIILSLFLSPIYALLFLAISYVTFKGVVTAYLAFRVKRRVKRVEEELPLMAMYMSTIGSLGINIHDMLEGLLNAEDMPSISLEVKKIFRDAKLFFGDVLSSLDWNARSHPSKVWSRYFMGLISIIHSGGNITRYFEEKTRELLASLKSRWSIYSERASDWGEMIIGIFLLAVALVLISAFIVPTDAYSVLVIIAVPVIPLLALTMIIVMEMLSPPNRDRIEFRPLLPTLSSLAAALLLAYLELEFWAILAISSIVFSLYNGYIVWRQLKEVEEEERWLPHLLRSLIDARKVGMPLDHAIAKIRGFGTRIDNILDEVTAQLKMGIPLNRARTHFRSWLAKMTFFVISNLAVYGGGTSEVLEKVYTFITDVQDAKSVAKSKMRLYAFLAAIAPIIVSAMLSITLGLASLYMNTLTGQMEVVGIGFSTLEFDYAGLISLSRLIVVESGIAMGLAVAKARSLTVKDTRLVALIVLISIASFMAFNYIRPEAILGIIP